MLIELLREGQRVRCTARGGSMWPVVRDGATMEVTPCAAASLRPGELGAFVGAERVVIHRVVAHENGGVRFRGDALGYDDGVVPAALVLGRARVVSSPRLGLRLPTARHVVAAARAARSWLRVRLART